MNRMTVFEAVREEVEPHETLDTESFCPKGFTPQSSVATQCCNCYRDVSHHSLIKSSLKVNKYHSGVLKSSKHQSSHQLVHEERYNDKKIFHGLKRTENISPIFIKDSRVNSYEPHSFSLKKNKTVCRISEVNTPQRPKLIRVDKYGIRRTISPSLSLPVTPLTSRKPSPERSLNKSKNQFFKHESRLNSVPNSPPRAPKSNWSSRNLSQAPSPYSSNFSSRANSPVDIYGSYSSLPRNFSSTAKKTEKMKRDFILNSFQRASESNGQKVELPLSIKLPLMEIPPSLKKMSGAPKKESIELNTFRMHPAQFPTFVENSQESPMTSTNHLLLANSSSEELPIRSPSLSQKTSDSGFGDELTTSKKDLSDILVTNSVKKETHYLSKASSSSELTKNSFNHGQNLRKQALSVEDIRAETEDLKKRVRQLEALEDSSHSDSLKTSYLYHELLALEDKLDESEQRCFNLLEENVDLKLEIETIISEMQDSFRDKDATEWKRIKFELERVSKTCRNYQLKLRRAQIKTAELKAKNDEIALQNLQSRTGFIRNMAIGVACLIAGYQIISKWR